MTFGDMVHNLIHNLQGHTANAHRARLVRKEERTHDSSKDSYRYRFFFMYTVNKKSKVCRL
jgi:hypothetical protein